MEYYKTRVKVIHKLTELNKNNRLKYCKMYENENFDKIIFSDEVMF